MSLSVFEIGEKIAVARKLRNLSQAQLADGLSISAQAVGKWERGESMPDIMTFQRMTEILGVDLNYFSDSKDTKSAEAYSFALVQKNASAPAKQRRWNMSRSNWLDADFSHLRGLAKQLSSSNIKRCRFVESELSTLVLKNNNIEQSEFTDSDLRKCKFSRSNVKHCDFRKADLSDSVFSTSSIEDCDFSATNMTGVSFKWSHVKNIRLSGATLTGVSFNLGELSTIVFDGELIDCEFDNCDFSRVEFNGAIIRNSFFKNSKLKRVKFVNCQADNISYSFMKSCKADLSDVTILE
ncbi:MAG: pentapeptide repeat-containing protein [Dehalococcoidia bacterium]|nr:pentapeptide repeat-containing protein [Dehalococcoidia bacterium]